MEGGKVGIEYQNHLLRVPFLSFEFRNDEHGEY